MSWALSNAVGKLICEALGLDSNVTRGLELSFYSGEVATVTVEQYLTEDRTKSVIRILEAVEWKAKEGEVRGAETA